MAPRSGTNNHASTPRVVPAQLKFLTIYNPRLGDSEETEEDQIVCWVGQDELGRNRHSRRVSKSPDRQGEQEASMKGKAQEHVTNERMRQIGLARGMVELARNFTSNQPLDTIETDRCRIVLCELERDWWILASVDLTRLPVAALQNKSNDDSPRESQSQFEYSAREVAPAPLLRTQLIKAHNLFLLHHSTSLGEMYSKLGRFNFCALLHRFWESFARRWDVLLHGNPAVDVYGDCIKLAGGGELGLGVGEEEWGSGEREVLEGFLERSEGCIECLVGRYGFAPAEKPKPKSGQTGRQSSSKHEKTKTNKEAAVQPWLGTGEDSGPADGIVFSGVGTISRKSLATVSQWMEAIFKHGDSAYGIGENPASRPRPKRRRLKSERPVSGEPPRGSKTAKGQGTEPHPRLKSSKNKDTDWRRKAMENNATPPGMPHGVPAPLVGQVERSLDDALVKATERSNSKSPKSSPQSSPKEEKSLAEAMKGEPESTDDPSSVFSMDGMKSILTFGYGSSWTLNPNGIDKKDGNKDEGSSVSKARPSKSPPRESTSERSQMQQPTTSGRRSIEERLQQIDPTPEVSDEDSPFVQKLEQSIGRFLIGLSGDLENAEFEDSDEAVSVDENKAKTTPQRIFLRTLIVELSSTGYPRPHLSSADRTISQVSDLSKDSAASMNTVRSREPPEPKTSAAASVDGPKSTTRYEKVQVAVYVHQPFIFVFLFELHTANLTMPAFYRSIHHQLGPLQKPLLQRTDPTRISERIASVLTEKHSAALSAVKKHVDNNGNAIYDLVYDPSRNTIRTSVPNIPIPTSPESAIKTSSTISGAWYTLGIPIGTPSSPLNARLDPVGAKSKLEPWTRIEALNVHSQILHTFSATRSPKELERTVKTSKGWWVLWMKISPRGKEIEEHKEAFLVRKSADYTTTQPGKDSDRSSSSGSPAGRWLLRDQSRNASGGNTAGSGMGAGAKGVSEGVGIDARKWVEGLLSLTE